MARSLRPAKTCRRVKRQSWTRVSKRRPRKSFVKGVPNTRVRQWAMGSNKRFEIKVELTATRPIQVRDNSIESARQAANKHLERELEHDYYLLIRKYPHEIRREHTALGVAGADRISSGMQGAFGKPKGRMARITTNSALLEVRLKEANLRVAKNALKRAALKLPGGYKIIFTDIRLDPENLKRPLEAEAVEDVPDEVIVKEESAEAAEGEEVKEGEEAKEGAEAESKPEEKKDDKKKEEKKK